MYIIASIKKIYSTLSSSYVNHHVRDRGRQKRELNERSKKDAQHNKIQKIFELWLYRERVKCHSRKLLKWHPATSTQSRDTYGMSGNIYIFVCQRYSCPSCRPPKRTFARARLMPPPEKCEDMRVAITTAHSLLMSPAQANSKPR
ncbi:hypothetical protein RUM43_007324 [Polyplax serrata]|uniref:Uncharacterized protein n=1 Tax=Polyplax serrata TaxID=468196 RepID=A0AAN8P1Q9_POLSC